jgi:hypothetical protein
LRARFQSAKTTNTAINAVRIKMTICSKFRKSSKDRIACVLQQIALSNAWLDPSHKKRGHSLARCQIAMHEGDGHRALADRGGDALD